MFERLTFRDNKGDVWIKDAAHVDEQGQICILSDRLAAYEDTGMEPEEVQELAKAKAEGRLVVLPVKVGDKVKVDARTLPWHYLHPADRCGDYANCKVIGVVKTKTRTYMKLVALYPSRMNSRGYLRYSVGAIGKTVFLTREGAEKALEEVEEG